MLFTPLFTSPEFTPVRWLELLIECSLKATMLIGVAALANLCLRHASAALRHWVWSTALAGVLLLPAAAMLLPAWNVDVTRFPAASRWMSAGAASPAVASRALESRGTGSRPGDLAAQQDVRATGRGAAATGAESAADDASILASSVKSVESPRRAKSPSQALRWVWLAGALMAMIPALTGRLRLSRLARDARSAHEPEWSDAIAEASHAVGLSRPVELLVSDRVAMPLTWGTLQPRVLMPASASEWPAERRRVVLLHELAHVRRLDCLTQTLAQFTCAVFWFHPLVWMAARRLRGEREQACDDVVLRSETRASDYAEHLLQVVRTLRDLGAPVLGAVAFARPSQLEGRLLAVLDDRRDRHGLSTAHATRIAVLVLGLLVPLSALKPAVAPAVAGQHSRRLVGGPSELIRSPEQSGDLEDRWAWASHEADRRGKNRDYWIGYLLPGSAGKGGLLCDSEGIDVSLLDDDYTGPNLSDVLEGREAKRISGNREGDRRELAILLHVTGGGSASGIDRVRAQTLGLPAELGRQPLFWLGRTDDARSIAWLQRLRGRVSDPEMKSQIVDVIAVHEDAGIVVPYLREILASDAPKEARVQAAEGLAHHPVKESLEALTRTARRDRSTEVRREAIEALGQLDMEDASGVLLEIAKSREEDPDLRREAVESLGDGIVGRRNLDSLDDLAGLDPPAQPPQPARAPQPPADLRETMGSPVAPREPAVPEDEVAPEPDAAEIDIQRQAVESLGNLPEEVSLPRLLSIVRSHPSEDVRLQAVESIGHLGSEAAFAALSSLSWKGTSPEIQREAVETLGRFPNEQSVPRLAEIARSHFDADVRIEAVEELGRIPTRQSIAVLDDLVAHDPDSNVQQIAVESIGRLPTEYSVPRLGKIARSHPDPDVRRRAIESLSRIDPDQSLPVLEEIIKNSPKKKSH